MEELHIKGYRIIRELGSGGMATVYLAIQESLDREVALKVMAPSLSAGKAFASRFMKEGRTVAKLNHANIVAIHDIGEFDHRHFMAMEYLDDGDLKTRIRKGLSPERVTAVLSQIAQALDYAHREGFIHRDVKPENILFSKKSGTAKLGDFGIAKAVDETSRLTGTGMSVGTPHYMSPEQGQGVHDLDGRSDLYSLGIVFYEMLTGKVPFDAANTVGIVMKHVQAPVPKLPPLVAKYQPLLDGLLAKDRNKRFSSAAELIKAIDAVQSGKPPQVPKQKYARPNKTEVIATPARQKPAPQQASSASQQSSSHGIVWALGGAALAVVIAVGALYFYQAKPVTQGGGAAVPVVQNQPRLQPATGNATTSNRSKRTASALEQQLAKPAVVQTGISVIPNPTTSRIFVNGAYAGTGALKITDLAPGASVTIRVQAEGYEPTEQVAWAPSDRLLQLDISLQKHIPRYALSIEPDPPDAQVRILNIEPKYQAGMLLAAGKYQVQVSKTGYVTVTRWLKISSHALSEQVVLQRANFALTVQVDPPDAGIRLLDPVQEYHAGMKLEPGKYHIEISKSGYTTQARWIDMNMQAVNLTISLQRASFSLTIRTDPPDTDIRLLDPEREYHDGMALEVGTYRYQVSKTGYKSLLGTVVISGGNKLERAELQEWIVGEVLQDCESCPEMVVIPKGKFLMGSKNNRWEKPPHIVQVNGFAISRTEVTFSQWDDCSVGGDCSYKPYDEGWGRGSRPVINVSWLDIKQYVNWLNKETNAHYRLPTEAEWEYAARAGSTTHYNWGNKASHEKANYGKLMCCVPKVSGRDRWLYTAPVGSFEPNAFGLFDMLGNVREWVEDCGVKGNYKGAPSDGTAWVSYGCNLRGNRGGSWSAGSHALRASYRSWSAPSARGSSLGFRVARDL